MSGLRLMFVLSVVVALSALNVDAAAAAVSQKLEVKVYYEALCWDSMLFIRDQLHPSMSEKGRLAYADLKFVPFGNVVSYLDPISNETVLQCQHGRKECQLNADHACIIENNTEEEAYDMITCLMRGFNTALDKCAEHYSINVEAAKKCRATRTIPDILRKYGEDTYKLNISFVPTVTMDGAYDYYEQDEILKSFDAVFCRKYTSKFGITLDGC